MTSISGASTEKPSLGFPLQERQEGPRFGPEPATISWPVGDGGEQLQNFFSGREHRALRKAPEFESLIRLSLRVNFGATGASVQKFSEITEIFLLRPNCRRLVLNTKPFDNGLGSLK